MVLSIESRSFRLLAFFMAACSLVASDSVSRPVGASSPRVDQAANDPEGGSGDLSVQFVFDVVPDDLHEAVIRGESEAEGPGGVESARPSGDDPLDEVVRFSADACDDSCAGDFMKCLDLFAHRDGQSWHGQRASKSHLGQIKLSGVKHEPDRGARAGVPVQDIVADR